MPSNPLQGGVGVWKCDKSQLSFRIFKYFILAAVAVAAEITLFKNNFSLLSKKKPKNKGRGLKSWGIVENGLYFENIKKTKQKN